jgi:hypothetical protein
MISSDFDVPGHTLWRTYPVHTTPFETIKITNKSQYYIVMFFIKRHAFFFFTSDGNLHNSIKLFNLNV